MISLYWAWWLTVAAAAFFGNQGCIVLATPRGAAGGDR